VVLVVAAGIAFGAVMMALPTDTRFVLYIMSVLGYAAMISGAAAIFIGLRSPSGDPLKSAWILGLGSFVMAANLLGWSWFSHPSLGLIGSGLALWGLLKVIRSLKRVTNEGSHR